MKNAAVLVDPEPRQSVVCAAPSPLQAILFDMDGTLADTERLGHRPAYNFAFRKLGLGWYWSPRLYRKLLQQPGGRERLQHYLKRYRPELGPHAARVKSDAGSWVDEVHSVKSARFSELLKRGSIPLRPGVARLIREARARGVRIAVVTNASRASVQPMLRHSVGPALESEIDLVVCGEDAAMKKPAPDLYRLAVERLGVQAEHCVAIEDSAMGMAAALAAGIPTLVTINENTRDQDFDGAALVVDGLGEPGGRVQVLRGRLDNGCVTLQDLEMLACA